MPAIRGVLFDMGHTLVHRVGEADAVVSEAAALGAAISPADAKDLWERVQAAARSPEAMGRGRDLSEEAHRREWVRLWADADEVAPGLAERMWAHERDPANWRLYPDVVEVLDGLRRRQIPVGIVSDTGWDWAEVLDRCGLRERFSTMVMSFQWGVIKPAPVLFEEACRALATAPAETLMVGDNHVADGGAMASGLVVLLLPAVPAGAERGLRSVLALVDGPADP